MARGRPASARGHPQFVALLPRRHADRPRLAPAGHPVEQLLPLRFGQHLRVPHTVHPAPSAARRHRPSGVRPTRPVRPRRRRRRRRGRRPTAPAPPTGSAPASWSAAPARPDAARARAQAMRTPRRRRTPPGRSAVKPAALAAPTRLGSTAASRPPDVWGSKQRASSASGASLSTRPPRYSRLRLSPPVRTPRSAAASAPCVERQAVRSRAPRRTPLRSATSHAVAGQAEAGDVGDRVHAAVQGLQGLGRRPVQPAHPRDGGRLLVVRPAGQDDTRAERLGEDEDVAGPAPPL